MKSFNLFLSFLLIGFLIIACNEEQNNIPTDPGTLEKGSSFTAEYEVTLENLSPTGSQPLSPPILAVHKPFFRIFHLGGFASEELAQVAQDAFNGPLVDLLNNSPKVSQVVVGGSAIPPGSSETYNITRQGRYSMLSLVSMLVNTNDGFTGRNRIRLPHHGTRTYYLRTYDAGSEKNTELTAHIPGPCCGNPFEGIPEHRRIRFHRGIRGVGDLDPAVYGWDEPIAKLTITRIN